MKKDISTSRKVLYYTGNFLTVIGAIMFASVFLSVFSMFGSPKMFEMLEPDIAHGGFGFGGFGRIFVRAPIGMVIMMVGQFLARVGKAGLAGSGVILNPEKAREDYEPYSRQVGGMVKDALDETGLLENIGNKGEVVKVKCRNCGELNDEDANFCDNCGEKL